VEILVALAIVATLSTACLAVLARLNRGVDTDALSSPAQTARLKSALVRAMADDLLHAGRFRAVEGGFEIQTTHWLDNEDWASRHRPTVVSYMAVSTGGRTILVRQQESADNISTELVAGGVAGVAVELMQEASQDEEAMPHVAAPGGWVPLSAIVRIVVRLDGRENGGGNRNELDDGATDVIILELPTSS